MQAHELDQVEQIDGCVAEPELATMATSDVLESCEHVDGSGISAHFNFRQPGRQELIGRTTDEFGAARPSTSPKPMTITDTRTAGWPSTSCVSGH